MSFDLVELSKIADSEPDNIPDKPLYIENIKSLKYELKIHYHFLLIKGI